MALAYRAPQQTFATLNQTMIHKRQLNLISSLKSEVGLIKLFVDCHGIIMKKEKLK